MVVYKKPHFRLLFAFIMFSYILGLGQEKLDSLEQKTFDELFEMYNNENDSKKSEKYLNVWIRKAKKQKNIKQLMTGYEISSLFYNDKRTLVYCDSILTLSTMDEEFNGYSASAHRIKGEYFYKKRDYKKELDNYLLAKEYIDKSNYPILTFSINYNIGVIKNRLGEHDEALKIHLKNLPFAYKFIKNNDNQTYLYAIYAIANTYNYIGKLDSAKYYNKFGYNEAISLKDKVTINFFTLNQGITHYYNKQYKAATDSLNKAISFFEKIKDSPNSAESYYYLGSTYSKTNNIEQALHCFKKIDTIFQITNDISPVVKNSYNYLVNYYKTNNDLKSQLYYVNQQIKIDSILYSHEVYLNKNLIKDYDIPRLISEKELIINSLKSKEKASKVIFYTLITFLSLLIIISVYQYVKRKRHKVRFEKIINKKEIIKEIINKKNINVPNKVISDVLSSLEKFEIYNEFLDPNITLQSLAKEIKTNTNYLSKIINSFKETSFSNYLNNLRIDYAVEQIQKNPIFRKYTIKAIAFEVGFRNSESFSKSFYKEKGIKPSYFLKELEKNKIS